MLFKNILITFLAAAIATEAAIVPTVDEVAELALVKKDQEGDITKVTRDDHDHEDHEHENVNPATTFSVSQCRFEGQNQFCVDQNGVEGMMVPSPPNQENAPTNYDGCHNHEDDTFCMSNNQEIQFIRGANPNRENNGTNTAANTATNAPPNGPPTTSRNGANGHMNAGVLYGILPLLLIMCM